MYIKIKVNTEVKKESFVKKTDTSYVIGVREKPERNLANKRILELVAHNFRLPVNKVRMISGHQSGSKILSLDIPNK